MQAQDRLIHTWSAQDRKGDAMVGEVHRGETWRYSKWALERLRPDEARQALHESQHRICNWDGCDCKGCRVRRAAMLSVFNFGYLEGLGRKTPTSGCLSSNHTSKDIKFPSRQVINHPGKYPWVAF